MRRARGAALAVCLLPTACGTQPPGENAFGSDNGEGARPASDVEAAPGSEPTPSEMPVEPSGEIFDGLMILDARTIVPVKYRKIGDLAVVGGDMIVATHAEMQQRMAVFKDLQDNALDSQGNAKQRLAVSQLTKSGDAVGMSVLSPNLVANVIKIMGWGTLDRIWPLRAVAFEIHPNIPEGPRREVIRQGVAMWNADAPIKLIPVAQASPDIKARQATLQFLHDPEFGCASWVGYRPENGRQEVAIGPNCEAGNVAHEVGHAFGLHHEHQRPDRAAYLKINSAIPNDTTNYGILRGKRLSAHDLCSIMHYGSWSTNPRWFSLTGAGSGALQSCASALKPECRSQDSADQVGQRCQLSPADVQSLKTLYGVP